LTKKTKILKERDFCRKCGIPVIKVKPRPPKAKSKYYFRFYLKCPKCYTMYMLESEKVYN